MAPTPADESSFKTLKPEKYLKQGRLAVLIIPRSQTRMK